MLGGADNPNGELLSYIIGADTYRCRDFVRMSIGDALTNIIPVFIQE